MIVMLTSAFDEQGSVWIAAKRIVQVSAALLEDTARWPLASSAVRCIGDEDESYTLVCEEPQEVVRRWQEALDKEASA